MTSLLKSFLTIFFRYMAKISCSFPSIPNQGYSVIGIIKELEQSFTLSPSGKDKWSKHTIEKILRNEKYVGTVTAMKTITVQHKRKKNEGEENKYVIEDNHPPIITREIFDAVQEEISRRSNIEVDENGQRTRKKNKYSSKNMLI